MSLLELKKVKHDCQSPTPLILYYFWNVVTVLILINVLISLFSSAYSDVVADAEAEYLAFFAEKTVAMIRAPDVYVYPAPFNLVEIFFVAPFESFLSQSTYLKLNRILLAILFFIPMTVVALYESSSSKHRWLSDLINGAPLDEDDSPAACDPEVDGEDARNGLVISKVPFSELVKVFPNTCESSEANIVNEIHEIKTRLDALIGSLDRQTS